MLEYQVLRLEHELVIKVPSMVDVIKHEVEFLVANKHLPILPVKVEEDQLKYHSGGLRTLDELLKEVIMSEDIFRKLLYNIGHAVNSLKHYLLDEHRLMLTPEMICVDHQYHVFLCYFPLKRDLSQEYSLSNLFTKLIDLQMMLTPDAKFDEVKQAINHPYFSSQLLMNVLKDAEVEEPKTKKVVIFPIIIGAIGILTITFTIVYFKFIKYIWISGLLTLGLVIYYFLTFRKKETKEVSEGTMVIQVKSETKLVHESSKLEIIMNDDKISIGRVKRGKHPLKSKSVSKTHAIVEKKQQGFFIEDLHSTNGTFLNGERLHPKLKYRINNGDEIKIAKEIFHFTCP